LRGALVKRVHVVRIARCSRCRFALHAD
jgi:hypothetical protein